MEQYLGQFLSNILASLEAGSLSNTIFEGFLYLAGFTLLAYLTFRIALLALKVGTIVGIIALLLTMGMPISGANHAGRDNNARPQASSSNGQISLPDFSQYISEEKLREVFLSYLVSLRK